HRKHPRGHGNNAGGMQHHRMNFNKHHSWLFQKSRYDTLSLEKKPKILCYCQFGNCGDI
ncbi:hypothetical protein Nmel_000562, partial [Mimus melanotis]